MATIKDVARLAGVSAGTVSNVLNRPSYVSHATRLRVLDAIAELDFRPTKSARQFRPGRERTLGLAVADLRNPFFVDVALGADAEAKRSGVGVVIVDAAELVQHEESNLDLLIQQRVHGIMISPVEESNPRLEELLDRGGPLVSVDRISGDRPCCWVSTDNEAGGRLAGEHLASLGHRRLAFVGGREISSQVEGRFEGFTTAVGGAARVERILTDSWRIADGRRAAADLVSRPRRRRPSAVLCANDLIALGLLQELYRHGIRVPEDIAVVGFDDLEWAAMSVIPLTSVRQDRTALGRLAVRMLLDEIERGDQHVHEHRLLQPELVARRSTETDRSGASC
jgi:LacI family transcriptional regulator